MTLFEATLYDLTRWLLAPALLLILIALGYALVVLGHFAVEAILRSRGENEAIGENLVFAFSAVILALTSATSPSS